MSLSAYDSTDLRVLSTVHSDAMEAVASSRVLTETERSDISKRIAENLMEAYDDGERDLGELKRVALRGILYRSLGAERPKTPADERRRGRSSEPQLSARGLAPRSATLKSKARATFSS